MKANFQSLIKLTYVFSCFDYIPLSFECTDLKTLLQSREIIVLGLLKLDYYCICFLSLLIRINAASWCGVYSRAAFINISALKCGVYSRAAVNRINTVYLLYFKTVILFRSLVVQFFSREQHFCTFIGICS